MNTDVTEALKSVALPCAREQPTLYQFHYGNSTFVGNHKIKDLLENNNNKFEGDVNELCWTSSYSRQKPYDMCSVTPLTLAARFSSSSRVVRRLLEHGADPNVPCDVTPLAAAVYRNKMNLVTMLLDAGANVNQLAYPTWKNKNADDDFPVDDIGFQQTPLHIARRLGHLNMMRLLLLKNASTSVRDSWGNLPLEDDDDLYCFSFFSHVGPHVALVYDQAKLISHFKTPLHVACLSGSYAEVASLVAAVNSHSNIVNAVDSHLNSPLHYACMNKSSDVVEFLIHSGADVDARNDQNKTPLEVSMECGYLGNALVLIEHLCRVHSLSSSVLRRSNSRGNNLLHLACIQSNAPVAFRLLRLGCSLLDRNKDGDRPIDYAWRYGDSDLLTAIAAHVMVIIWKDNDNAAFILEKLVQLVTTDHPPRRDVQLSSAFLAMCQKFGDNFAELLLNEGLPTVSHMMSGLSETQLGSLFRIICTHYVKGRANIGSRTFKLLKKLSNETIDANLVDKAGNTCLHLACIYGNLPIVKILFDSRCNADIANKYGRNALSYAFEKDHSEIVRYLVLEKRVDASSVLSEINSKGNTLLLMIYSRVLDDDLLLKLAETGARLNRPNVIDHGNYLLEKICSSISGFHAAETSKKLAQRLVQMGCCDYSNAGRLLGNENDPKWWKWLRLAGFPVSYADIEAAGWTESRTQRAEMEWLVHEMENPPSLYRQCVYRIRSHLAEVVPGGKTIFPAIDKLPLPKCIKETLKLNDVSVECNEIDDVTRRTRPAHDIIEQFILNITDDWMSAYVRHARALPTLRHTYRPLLLSANPSCSLTFRYVVAQNLHQFAYDETFFRKDVAVQKLRKRKQPKNGVVVSRANIIWNNQPCHCRWKPQKNVNRCIQQPSQRQKANR